MAEGEVFVVAGEATIASESDALVLSRACWSVRTSPGKVGLLHGYPLLKHEIAIQITCVRKWSHRFAMHCTAGQYFFICCFAAGD